MPLSQEEPARSTNSSLKTESSFSQQGNTLYAFVSGKMPQFFDGWMSSERAKAWLLSNELPPTRRHRVVMKCPVCQTIFTRSPSKLRNSLDQCEKMTHTCSPSCMGVMKTHQRTVKLTCEGCGEPFTLSLSEHTRRLKRGDGHHFCSNACYGRHRSQTYVGENHHNYTRKEVVCSHCGKVFLRQESKTKTWVTKTPFCSKGCYHKHLSGRHTQKGTGRGSLRSYPEEFKKLRKEILKEALCVVCMYPAKDVHHLDGNPENNLLSNLVPVCRRCHTRHHASTPHPLLLPSNESTAK